VGHAKVLAGAFDKFSKIHVQCIPFHVEKGDTFSVLHLSNYAVGMLQ
jgi:hypothetical protein